MEASEIEDNSLGGSESTRLTRRIALLEEILRENRIDFEDTWEQNAHQSRENNAGTKDALVGLYMLANSKAAGVQQPQPARQQRHPQPALLNGLNLRPLQTERPFRKSSRPAETEKVREYQATMWEVGKQRREAMGSTSAGDVPDYFSLSHDHQHYAAEVNPFEIDFATKPTPGGTRLPSVAELTSPGSKLGQSAFWSTYSSI
jgi:hypothetical protein